MANKNIELGRRAESDFIAAASRAGWHVAKPLTEGLTYDYLCAVPMRWGGERLVRVQVKAATSGADGQWDVLCRQKVDGKFLPYASTGIDVMAIGTGEGWWIIPAIELPLVTHFVLRSPGHPVKPRQKRYPLHSHLTRFKENWKLTAMTEGSAGLG